MTQPPRPSGLPLDGRQEMERSLMVSSEPVAALHHATPRDAVLRADRKPPAAAGGVGSHDPGLSPGKASGHQPSTFTVTVLTLLALGAVTVSSPSRYTACSCSRSMATGKRKLRLHVP